MAKREGYQGAVDQFSDWRWRLNNLYWITDKDGRRVKFEMNWAQAALFDEMHYLNLILKARQLGFTTFIQLFMLDSCVFNSNIRAGTIAHTLGDAEIIFRDKVKYPYDNLPDGIRAVVPASKDAAKELVLKNNSSLRVGTSLRSGTLQYLHISEYGKVCAKFPDKAREIRSGALNTVQAGQVIWIESTAEGQEGDFYESCKTAQSAQRVGSKLTPLDFKFLFYAWWQHPDYQLDPEGVAIPAVLAEYFEKLTAEHGIVLTDAQKAWYAKKADQQKEDMKREFPSTPDEAFEAAVEGAYYGKQIAELELKKQVTRVPYDPHVLVETWWDLGIGDAMSIWFVQRVGIEIRVIDYYENAGEGLAHYAKLLGGKPYVYGRHIAPHDIEVRELTTGKSRKETAEALGLRFEVAPMLSVEDGIESVRGMLPRCWFDEENAALGLRALKAYRKEWNEKLGTWHDYPRHDWASHGADSFRTGAVAAEPVVAGGKIDYPKVRRA